MKKCKTLIWLVIFVCMVFLFSSNVCNGETGNGKPDNSPDWFYPSWAASAKYNTPITVLDTDSALGRYSLKTKAVGLKDVTRFHGHMCDGLFIAFVEIRAVLGKLFPNGTVDRTDLRAVSKNGPCWVDTVMYMTGARTNFQTLRIDSTIGDGFIIQKISTGETYSVHLKPGVFPTEQAELEGKIRKLRAEGKPVSAGDIDTVEAMADALSKKLLNTQSSELLEINPCLVTVSLLSICLATEGIL
ncbi:MAG: formylmethanofuran dehydrogenase subunit E family protein [Proteobacteria bacterium]|nr:formylmethanofuran dehydrogenase subunit E family protein [Pseudomonadota bacterium]